MEFEYSDRCQHALQSLRRFMDAHVYPNEQAYYTQHAALASRWQTPPLMEELKARAKQAGLWNLFLPASDHGPGFSNLDYAPLCEEMGRVGFAPDRKSVV